MSDLSASGLWFMIIFLILSRKEVYQILDSLQSETYTDLIFSFSKAQRSRTWGIKTLGVKTCSYSEWPLLYIPVVEQENISVLTVIKNNWSRKPQY